MSDPHWLRGTCDAIMHVFTITHVWCHGILWWDICFLSHNGEEALDRFFSPDPDPHQDNHRGGPSHGYNTCIIINYRFALLPHYERVSFACAARAFTISWLWLHHLCLSNVNVHKCCKSYITKQAPSSFDGTHIHWAALTSFIERIAGDFLRLSDANDAPKGILYNYISMCPLEDLKSNILFMWMNYHPQRMCCWNVIFANVSAFAEYFYLNYSSILLVENHDRVGYTLWHDAVCTNVYFSIRGTLTILPWRTSIKIDCNDLCVCSIFISGGSIAGPLGPPNSQQTTL